MGAMLYEVIRDAVTKQRTGAKDENLNCQILQSVYDELIRLEHIVREEGLLALEDEVAAFVPKRAGEDVDLSDGFGYRKLKGQDRLLAVLAKQVTDGNETEDIEETAAVRYYAGRFEGTDALAACMMIVGILSIHKGINPGLFRDKLLALMPEEAAADILKIIEHLHSAGEIVLMSGELQRSVEEIQKETLCAGLNYKLVRGHIFL